MSFGSYAATVRDDTVPHARRLRALGSCVQMYRPIGFQATFAYLRELHGPLRRDPAALTPALGTLTASRDEWLRHVARYAADRRAAKALGHRIPRGGVPVYWYGARREAALAALRHWRHRRLPLLLAAVPDPIATDLDACVTAALETGGYLPELGLRAFADTNARLAAGLYQGPAPDHRHTSDLVTVARLIGMTLPSSLGGR